MKTENTATPILVLASTSPFRKEILQKLDMPFETASPDIDESPLQEETPQQLVQRLAEQKAQAVADNFPNALIIGSDQVAVIDGEILGKPGTHDRAVEQLQNASGKTVHFYTGLCLYNTVSKHNQVEAVPFDVVFRDLSAEQIENYLRREQPYNCAGSFKSEALGIALFERFEGSDPNALIGLPLIELVNFLGNEGFSILD